MEQQRKIEIDIFDLLQYLKKRIVIILAFTLICAIIGFVYCSFFVTPMYMAETRMYILNRTNESYVGSADFQISNYMLKDYTVLITGQNVTKEVISRLGLRMSPGALRQKIIVSAPENTRVLQINVEDADPQVAADIANMIYTVASQQIQSIMDVGSVKLVYAAEAPTAPISPNVQKGVTNAAAIGFIIVLIVFLLIYVIDGTIRSEEDVKHYLDLCVLGVIPQSEDISESPKEKKFNINFIKKRK